MPDFSMNVNYGQPQGQMTLGDILNVARGAQAYQQAQQINPLALQKAQMEVQQAQQLNPLAVKKATEEAAQAQIGTQQKKLELDQSHFNLAGNVLSGLEARAITLADKKDTATAMKELKAAEQWLNASGVPSQEKGAFKMAEQQLKNGDFAGYQATLENMRNILGGAASRYQANLPQVSTVAGAPAAFTQATGVAKPLTIGGQGASAGGGGGGGGGAPAGVTPTQMSLSYPVRKAGDIRPYAPNEEKDQASGFDYRDKLTSTATNVSTSLRNIDEVIKEAEKIGKEEWMKGSGLIGSLGRNVSTILGTEQGDRYKRLSKDLANLQLSLGADKTTDAGKNLVAAANGDITLPPDVLLDIAHRSKADRENVTMQAAGAQAFAKKYGDSNMKTFQQLWGENSKDTRLFEAIAINNSNMSQKEKKDRIDELFDGLSAKQIDKLTQQKNNLIKLSRTGEL